MKKLPATVYRLYLHFFIFKLVEKYIFGKKKNNAERAKIKTCTEIRINNFLTELISKQKNFL
jgi:hypothetical protein